MNPDAMRLDDLLDCIDSKKKMKTNECIGSSERSDTVPALPAAYTWSKHFDQTAQKFYYYNHKTQVSTWEKPLLFDEKDKDEVLTVAKASFNARSASFAVAGDQTYFEKVGRPNDREGKRNLSIRFAYYFRKILSHL